MTARTTAAAFAARLVQAGLEVVDDRKAADEVARKEADRAGRERMEANNRAMKEEARLARQDERQTDLFG
tara:strand:- start:977 stop:1186 length:210 start_codon:yes stop_codon:yes gene_type:complete